MGTRVDADEIVEPVAAGDLLDEQVVVEEGLKQQPGLPICRAGQAGRGVRVEVRAGDQAEALEQLAFGRVGETAQGRLEDGGDAALLVLEVRQPVVLLAQFHEDVTEPQRRPAGETCGDDPYRQRKEAA
jgi:hypothetical protein